MNRLPRNSADLIRQLDENEGPLRVSPKDTLAEIHYKAGRRAVIDALLIKLEAFEAEQGHFQVINSEG